MSLRFFFNNIKLQKQHVVFLRFDIKILGAVIFFGQVFEAFVAAVTSGGFAVAASISGEPAGEVDRPTGAAGISGEPAGVSDGSSNVSGEPAGSTGVSGGPIIATAVIGGAAVTATGVPAIRQVLKWLKNSSFLTITFGQ